MNSCGSAARTFQRWVRKVSERGWEVWYGKTGSGGKRTCHSGEEMKHGWWDLTARLNCSDVSNRIEGCG